MYKGGGNALKKFYSRVKSTIRTASSISKVLSGTFL